MSKSTQQKKKDRQMVIILAFFALAVAFLMSYRHQTATLKAEIIEIDGKTLRIREEGDPNGEYILSSDELPAVYDPRIGDVLQVIYDGEILETYPARFHKIYRVIVKTEEETS